MKKIQSPSRTKLLGLPILLCLTLNVFAQPEQLWKSTFGHPIQWLKVAPTGQLLAGTKKSLLGIDPANGEVLWQRDDLKGLIDWQRTEKTCCESWLEEFVPFTPYAVLRIFSGANKTFKHSGLPDYLKLINVLDGQDMWTTQTMGLKHQYGYFFLPEIGGMLIYAKDKKKKKTVVAVEIATGTVLWKNRNFFKKRNPVMFPDGIVGNQEPLFDTEETMITFMNKKAIRKFNAATGELIWETEVKAKEVSAPRNGYAPMILGENRETLYAACVKKSLFKWYGIICAIRTSDGKMIWKKPVKFKGGVTQMQQAANGLIVKGVPIDEEGLPKTDKKPFFALLDPVSGKVLWKKEYTVLTGGSDFVVRDNDILVYAKGKLLTVNLLDGMLFEIGKDLKFKGKETPAFIDIRDDGIFLQSSNNLMLVSLMGEKVYHAYHEAPGFSWWEKLAGLAGSMAAASYLKTDDISGATDFIFAARFKATINLETYTYMLARIETGKKKKVGLVKVNKNDGTVENQIILGTRRPTYSVDEYESLLFLKSNKREIVCYRF